MIDEKDTQKEASFIFRCIYTDDEKLNKRLELFKKYTLPSLLNQTDQDFDINMWVYPKHEELIKSIHPRIKTFNAEYIKRKTKHFVCFTPWSLVKNLYPYKIQMGLDTDDVISPDYVEKIKELCKGDKNFLISFQPIFKDLKNNQFYRGRDYKKRNRSSAFFAMYQPDKTNYKFAYYRSHMSLPEDFNTLHIDEGFCTVLIHGGNDSTKVRKFFTKIK